MIFTTKSGSRYLIDADAMTVSRLSEIPALRHGAPYGDPLQLKRLARIPQVVVGQHCVIELDEEPDYIYTTRVTEIQDQ